MNATSRARLLARVIDLDDDDDEDEDACVCCVGIDDKLTCQVTKPKKAEKKAQKPESNYTRRLLNVKT